MLLFNRYEVIEELGKGGMARVVLVKDIISNIQIALKILDNMYIRRCDHENNKPAGRIK